MAGDYTKFQRHHGAVIVDYDVTILQSQTAVLVTPRNVNQQVYLQSVRFFPKAYPAAPVTISVTDSTGLVVGTLTVPAAAPGLGGVSGEMYLDYGPTGSPLTLGATLSCVFSAPGLSGRLHIEGYQRQGQTISISLASSLQ